eukprot:gene4862-8456_t
MNCSQIYQKHLKESVVKLESFLQKDEFSCTSYRQLTEWILNPFVNDNKNLLEVELFFDTPMFKNSKLQRIAVHIRLVRILGNFGSHKEGLENELTLHEKISLISSTITILEILIKHFTETEVDEKLEKEKQKSTPKQLQQTQPNQNQTQLQHITSSLGNGSSNGLNGRNGVNLPPVNLLNTPPVSVMIPSNLKQPSISDLKTPEIDDILSFASLEIDESFVQNHGGLMNGPTSNSQRELNNDANEILQHPTKMPSLDQQGTIVSSQNRKSLEDRIIKSPKMTVESKRNSSYGSPEPVIIPKIPNMSQDRIYKNNSQRSSLEDKIIKSPKSYEDKIIKSPKMTEKSPKNGLKSPKNHTGSTSPNSEPLKSPNSQKKENERDMENKSLIEAFKKNFKKGSTKEQRNYLFDSLPSKFKDLMVKNHGTYKTFLTKNDHLFACKGDYVELIDTSKMQFKIFVSGLSKEIDSKNLRKHFEQCGKVGRFARPKEIYAFITFEDNDSFQNALKLNGTFLKNSCLRIQRAKE